MNANPRQAPLPPRRACRTARGRACGRLDWVADGEFTGRPGRHAKKRDNAPPSGAGAPGAKKFEILNFIQTCFATGQAKPE
ncbi:hypothetical protein AMP9_3690 [plant metagenome]|uniref:Uncharacterized protein n=1 Tax=plant metagenome TaxID=1297885 RepID=A0A484Q0D9_9ZZZZ